jgi:hypothetical protein
MTADVYAGDESLREGARSSRAMGVATFDILADADPDLVARVGAILTLLNIAPRVFHMESRPEGMAAVRAFVDCAESQAELLARKLERLTSVRDVNMSYASYI